MARAKQGGWPEFVFNTGVFGLGCFLLVCLVIAEGESKLVTSELITQAKHLFGDGIQEVLEGWGESLDESSQADGPWTNQVRPMSVINSL